MNPLVAQMADKSHVREEDGDVFYTRVRCKDLENVHG